MDVVRRPYEALAHHLGLAAVVLIGLVAATWLLRADLGPSASAGLHALLPWLVRLLVLLAGVLGASLGLLWLAPEQSVSVGVSGFVLHVGPARVPAEALRACDTTGDGLVVRTRGGRLRLTHTCHSAAQLLWLRDEIRGLRRRWVARQGRVPAEIERLRQA